MVKVGDVIIVQFWIFIFLLFLTGVARIIFSIKNLKNPPVFSRLILLIIFLFPFLLFCLAGLINIKFGWARNFFYLLPIYILIAFYGLRGVITNNRYYYAVSAVVLIVWGCAGIIDGANREMVNLEREMVRCAEGINGDPIIVVYDNCTAVRAFEYNARNYNIQNRVLFLSKDAPVQFEILERISRAKTFVVIERLQKNALIKIDKYYLGKKSFDILKTDEYKTWVGPFQFLKKFKLHSGSHIVIYFCKS